jgi:hypothetical protein
MLMAVVRIGKMLMEVRQGKMGMPVAVGRAIRTRLVVGVLMMGAVRVGMFMKHLFVPMIMLVTLGQVQPDAPGHESRGGQEPDGDLFPEQDDTHQAADKGRHRKIGPGAGHAEMPQRPDEQHQAGAVTQKAQETGRQGDPNVRKNAIVPGGDGQVSSPAAIPLIMAICTGSHRATFRDNLLSIPQARQAAATANGPHKVVMVQVPDQASIQSLPRSRHSGG